MRAGVLIVSLAVLVSLAALGAGGCARCNAPPEAPEASVVSPPPPAAPAVRDAAPDVTDARSDAGDGPAAGPAHHAAKKRPAAPSGGGGAGGFKVEGSLPKADAEKVVRGAFGKLRACNPDLPGRVTFRLTVDARGRVTLGEVVTSTLASGDPEMCMIRATRDFKFPAAAGESTIGFAMNFGR